MLQTKEGIVQKARALGQYWAKEHGSIVGSLSEKLW